MSVSPDSSAPIQAALEVLWIKFLPQIEERLAVLEAAAAELSAGTLTPGHSRQAHEAAHKLAGVLGTFGLTKGTVLAREAELLYIPDDLPDAEQAPQLMQIAAQIRAMIDRVK